MTHSLMGLAHSGATSVDSFLMESPYMGGVPQAAVTETLQPTENVRHTFISTAYQTHVIVRGSPGEHLLSINAVE